MLFLWNILRVIAILILLAFGIHLASRTLPTLRRYKLLQKLPGPKGIFLIGSALDLLKVPATDIIYWVENRLKNFDRFMKVWTLGVGNVYLKDPNDLQVLLSSTEHITKGLEYFIVRPWLKEGLITSAGNKWRARRKIITPAFHFKILEDNMVVFNKNAKELRDKFEDTQGEDVELEHYITHCTLDIIVRTAMGIEIDPEEAGGRKYLSALKIAGETLAFRAMNPILLFDFIFYLSSKGRIFNEALSYLHDFTDRVIKEKRAKLKSADITSEDVVESSGGKVLKAFLDRILEYELKDPGSFSDSGIREEVDTFMFAGHDTTSATLEFIFYSLSVHPEIQDKVHEELCDIFGDDTERDVTTSDLQRMVYLEKVIKEALRLYPSVSLSSRLLTKDLILSDGTIIPEGTNVILSSYVVHRTEKYWPDPTRFDPERFSDEQIRGRHPYAYIPFSAGPRKCIGQKFAMMEMKTIVSNVLRKLKVLPSMTNELKLTIILVLRPFTPIKCKFVKR